MVSRVLAALRWALMPAVLMFARWHLDLHCQQNTASVALDGARSSWAAKAAQRSPAVSSTRRTVFSRHTQCCGAALGIGRLDPAGFDLSVSPLRIAAGGRGRRCLAALGKGSGGRLGIWHGIEQGIHLVCHFLVAAAPMNE